jgi:osmotically-inducible protein OsmY
MPTLDLPLEEQAHAAIKRSPYLARERLQLEATGGRVVLKGVVGTYFQKQMAQEALRRVDGIHEIENNLEVSWGARQEA